MGKLTTAQSCIYSRFLGGYWLIPYVLLVRYVLLLTYLMSLPMAWYLLFLFSPLGSLEQPASSWVPPLLTIPSMHLVSKQECIPKARVKTVMNDDGFLKLNKLEPVVTLSSLTSISCTSKATSSPPQVALSHHRRSMVALYSVMPSVEKGVCHASSKPCWYWNSSSQVPVWGQRCLRWSLPKITVPTMRLAVVAVWSKNSYRVEMGIW